MSDDAVLWSRWARERDEAAFSLLARRHADLVADVAFRAAGGDRARAEDALQEALLALARERTDRPAVVGVRAWLARAAMTRALHARASDRARARRERVAGTRRGEDTMGADRASAAEAVRAAMADVGGEDAAVLAMRFLHGMEYGELAKVLDVAEPTARVRVHRAMERLRAAARRDDADEGTVARALAALPTFAAPAAVVESAVASAMVASAMVASATATLAATSTARWLVGLAVVAVATTGGLVAYRALDDRDAAPPEERTIERSSDGSPGRPALVGRATSESDAPVEESTPPADLAAAGLLPPPKPAPPRGPPAPLFAPKPGARVALRAELVRADGRVEPVPVDRVTAGGTTWAPSLASPDWRLETKPGAIFSVLVDDPRAAVQGILVTVPDPVPETLTVRVPSKDDPRLERLVLEVVDEKTGAPLPDARIEWGDDDSPARTQHADAHGRIVLSLPGAPEQASLKRYAAAERWIHAPGHRGEGWVRGSREPIGAVFEATQISSLLDRGVLTIPLASVTHVEGVRDRTVRILEADGRPAAGVYAHVVYPQPDLGGKFHDAYTFHRADADGVVSFPLRDVAGIEVRRRGEPVAAWLLAQDSWPASGPRELRLPRMTEVELSILDMPEGERGSWSLDPLGPKRSFLEWPVTKPTTDPEVERLLEGRRMVVSFLGGGPSGPLEGPRATLRFWIPVGGKRTVHLWRGSSHRTWDVLADGPEPLRESRSWRDLPLAESDGPLILHYPELDFRR